MGWWLSRVCALSSLCGRRSALGARRLQRGGDGHLGDDDEDNDGALLRPGEHRPRVVGQHVVLLIEDAQQLVVLLHVQDESIPNRVERGVSYLAVVLAPELVLVGLPSDLGLIRAHHGGDEEKDPDRIDD